MNDSRIARVVLVPSVLVLALVAGCYKEMPNQGRTGAAPAPAPPPPAQAAAKPSSNSGPVNSLVNQPGSSALGHAKRSAQNTIGQAEQQSQQTADNADDPLGTPKPKPQPEPEPES